MNLLLAEINPTVLFLVGLSLVVWMVLRWTRHRLRSRPADNLLAPVAPTHAADHPLIPPVSLAQWEVSMHELARDLSGQLDTKIRIVQQLVLRAEEERKRLEAVLQRAELVLEHEVNQPADAGRSGRIH